MGLRIPYIPRLPVNTAWAFGSDGRLFILFHQAEGNTNRLIDQVIIVEMTTRPVAVLPTQCPFWRLDSIKENDQDPSGETGLGDGFDECLLNRLYYIEIIYFFITFMFYYDLIKL
jgi:hypothetical protein